MIRTAKVQGEDQFNPRLNPHFRIKTNPKPVKAIDLLGIHLHNRESPSRIVDQEDVS